MKTRSYQTGAISAPTMKFSTRPDDQGGLSESQFQATVLRGVEALSEKSKEASHKISVLEAELQRVEDVTRTIRRANLNAAVNADAVTNGVVSHDCAKFLGAIALHRGLSRGQILDNGDSARRFVDSVLGKSALTTNDIPLPVGYSGEVVELVAKFGAARKYGTVLPLPSGSMKIPRLKTDPVFGLIAMSAAIPQKSPQVEFVTFDAKKWGGLIILPSEIEEDSAVGVGQFVARYAARQMAKMEDAVFFNADGTATYDSLSGLTKSVVTDSKTVALASTKTKYSDLTMAKFRELRSTVDAPVLGDAKYFLHPTFEQLLASFNTAGDKPYIANGIAGASFDGFPIAWVDSLPAYSTSANAESVFALFGDLSYQYLGVRGVIRFDASDAPGFATDQLYIRALERFTIGKMATGAVGGLITAAS